MALSTLKCHTQHCLSNYVHRRLKCKAVSSCNVSQQNACKTAKNTVVRIDA